MLVSLVVDISLTVESIQCAEIHLNYIQHWLHCTVVGRRSVTGGLPCPMLDL